MYERESEIVRLGVDFLTALTEKDYLTDPSFDPVDLESKLNEIQADVNFLISNLPVEAIDDDQEREDEYAGDFEDSEELEDEVVECERLIAQATGLMAAVRAHYLPNSQESAEEQNASVAIQQDQMTVPKEPARLMPKKKRLDDVAEFQLYFIILLVVITIITLIIEGR